MPGLHGRTQEGGTVARTVDSKPTGYVAILAVTKIVPRVVIGRVDVNEVETLHRPDSIASPVPRGRLPARRG